MRIAFIINSMIRSRAKVISSLENGLEYYPHWEVDFFYTTAQKTALTLSRQATQQSYDVIIAVGGDGTLNESLNGIMLVTADRARESRPKLGLLPYGISNDFSRTLGIEKNIRECLESIEKQKTALLDVGKVSYMTENDQSFTEYFMNILDIGMGADVVKKVERSKNRLAPRFIYFHAIVQTFFHYRHKALTVKTENWEWQGPMMTVAIANGKYFGNGLGIAPDADPSSGSLAVTILGKVGVVDYLRKLGMLKRCQKINHPQVHYRSAQWLRIIPGDHPSPVEADGEFLGQLRLEAIVVPQAIEFIVPN